MSPRGSGPLVMSEILVQLMMATAARIIASHAPIPASLPSRYAGMPIGRLSTRSMVRALRSRIVDVTPTTIAISAPMSTR
ncbi:unannotated protein [freshwater metagenome]|uniref:Unannotated protein n=1 Tax=freshwater metagenome TaxID=449393 RepID=A0A6J7CGR0_9ZZZZ